jgi:NAD(P)-dependent dehydrogenase (short-subunit alcohol dehydrogenase family)
VLTLDIVAIHLAQHYVKQGIRQEGDVKAIVIMSSIGAFYQTPGTGTYAAAKAGISALVRTLEPFNTKAGIRTGVIYPWFAGALVPIGFYTCPDVTHGVPFADTDLIRAAMPLLEGFPLTPVSRIANAVLRAATDPDLSTSSCAHLLPDDGPVLQISKNRLLEGVHPMLTKGMYAELENRFMKAYKLRE